jgi:hypothetical protein
MKAIALISGGLDSILAAKVIQNQGIEIIPLHFKTPFSHKNKESSCGSGSSGYPEALVKHLGAVLRSMDLAEDFFEIIRSPRYGFGSNMNPCIDCKILMLKKAREFMAGADAKFIITGEVLGQRPMSQHKQALKIIARGAGLEGLILRPLSARLLPETIPEEQGWVERVKLLSFSGRTRRPQMELAKELNITEYPNPAGGCLLTDPGFSGRLKEFLLHGQLSKENVELLKIGRHFRLTPDTKLVVGRDEEEDNLLLAFARENDYLFFPSDELAGPTALGRGVFNAGLIKLSCAITCRYCDLNGENEAEIRYKKIPEDSGGGVIISAIGDAELLSLRI